MKRQRTEKEKGTLNWYFDQEDIKQELECMKLEGKSVGFKTPISIIRKWTNARRSIGEDGTLKTEPRGRAAKISDYDEDRIDLSVIDRDESKRKLVELKASLKERELEIVEHMERGLTLEEVGNEMGLTGPRISQILREIRNRFGEQ